MRIKNDQEPQRIIEKPGIFKTEIEKKQDAAERAAAESALKFQQEFDELVNFQPKFTEKRANS